VLMYHLVTGTYPVLAGSLTELRAAHRTGRKRLNDTRPELPDAFVQVVERALSTDPARRFPSAGAMQDALTRALGIDDPASPATTPLRDAAHGSTSANVNANAAFKHPWLLTIGIIVGAVTILAVAALIMTRVGKAPAAAGPINSIILLPFANLSSADKDLATGIDLLIAEQLAMLPGMRIVHYVAAPPNGQGQGQGPQLSIAEMLQREQADAAVTGSVTWTGSRAQVFAQLVRAGASTPVWTRQFDVPARRAAELPRAVARDVASVASLRLSDSDNARLADSGAAEAAKPDAFEAYLRGRVKLREGSVSAIEEAIEQFQEALKRDPQHAPSYAGLARCYLLQAVTQRTLTLAQGGALTREAVQHALTLDDHLPDAYVALADLRLYMDWDWSGAEDAYRQAIALSPNAGEVREKYAMFLASRKRLPDAIRELQRAVSLDPMSPLANAALGMLWHYAQDDAQAERIFRGALEQDPTLRAAHAGLVRVLINSRRYREALTDLDGIKPREPETEGPFFLGARAIAVAGLGQRDEAERLADTLTRQDSDGASVDGAGVYAALGESDKALAILTQAVDLKHPKVLFLRLDPRFKSLRTHPRFRTLLQRMGLDS
jgi:Tfp pilus assembly protein PilF/TolB-like protein